MPGATTITASRLSRVLVPVLILLFVLQCAWFIRTQSFTVDEPEHIVAGLEAWRFGEFEHWHDQPPIARLLFALPLLRTDWKYQLIDQQVHPIQPAPEVWLYRARAMNVLLGVALLLVIWFTARHLFSESAATFALALAALSPDLIAHFSLATIDGAGTLFILIAVVQLMRWRRRPTRGQTVLLGLALGVMLIAKFNSPPLFLLALVLILISKPQHVRPTLVAGWPTLVAPGVGATGWESSMLRPRSWHWGKATLVCVLAFMVVWTTYFFHVSKVLFENNSVTLHFSGYTKSLTYEMPTPRHLQIYIPACEYLTGLGMVVYHNHMGHRSFLLGHVSPTGGWIAYFLVAVILKWPLIILLLALAGAVLFWSRRLPARRELLMMSLFPALYFLLALFSRINIGVRHVLPVYPFLLLFAAATWEALCASRRARMILIASVLLLAVDTLRYAPDYLSYFNLPVNPARSYEYLSDSNVDWGQGLVALRRYQASHPGETLHLAYFGLVDPAWYGIRYVPLNEGERATGTVVVSSTHLSGQLLHHPASYRWLLAYPRKALLNHTLYVFDVPANAPGP